MEVKLDKRYPLPASLAQAWAVLCDIRATAACMPGAQITEQLDETHFKGTVKSKVGPAVMSFGGDIELLALEPGNHRLKMMGKGADKSGSSAQMDLDAHLEPGDGPDSCVLVGQASILVSGKLAQFGSRLLVPVSDAMLAQFARNFAAAAQAVRAAEQEPQTAQTGSEGSASAAPQAAAAAYAAAAAPAPPAPVRELNALGLMWTVFKGWLAGLFGGKR